MNKYRVTIDTSGQLTDVIVYADDEIDAQSQALQSMRKAPQVIEIQLLGETTQAFGDEHLNIQTESEGGIAS